MRDAPSPTAPAAVVVDPRPGTAEQDARLSALRARSASLAPGMRLVALRASTEAAIEVARADRQDECVRVAFEADEPILVGLADGRGDALARTSTPAFSGVLGPGGPVCVRKGASVTATVERLDAGPASPVLWIAWASP